MRVGVTIFGTDRTIDPVVLAREVEDRGLASLYLPEHTHIPVSRDTPPPSGDDVLAEEYARTLDPLVALSAAAAVTTHLELGTGVALVAQHEPLAYAKAWATLDHLSGGRCVMGVGFGWNVEEMANHAVDMATRRERVADHVAAMRELWRSDEARYEGEFVAFTPSWSWPKPHAGRDIPVLLGGGSGPKLLGAVVDWADGWMPIGSSGLRAVLPGLRERWAAAGRAGAPRVVPFGVEATPAKLTYLAGLGVDEVVVRIPSAPVAPVLAALDELVGIIDDYRRG